MENESTYGREELVNEMVSEGDDREHVESCIDKLIDDGLVAERANRKLYFPNPAKTIAWTAKTTAKIKFRGAKDRFLR